MINILKRIVALFLTCCCFMSIVGCMGVSNNNEEQICNHSYSAKITKNATCGEKGEKVFTCKLCGDSYTEDVQATGAHSFTSKITKEPSCKEEGIEKYTCLICGDSYNKSIDKTNNHSYIRTIIKEATDTIQGERKHTCTICWDSYIEAFLLSKVTCRIGAFNRAFIKNGLGESDGYLECNVDSVRINQDNELVSIKIKWDSHTTNVSRYNNRKLFGVIMKKDGSQTIMKREIETPNIPAGETKYTEIYLSNAISLTEGVEYEIYPYVI